MAYAASATPQTEDLVSVGTRISWGAILGGGLVALAIYFMLTVLGAAVGLTIGDRLEPASLGMGAVIWSVLTLATALFVGGLMTSLFTVGENKIEAAFYGVILWALVLGLLLFLAGTGVRSGFNGMVGLASIAQASAPNWENAARQGGVPQTVIDDWRKKAADAARDTTAAVQDPQTQQELREAATRVAWWAFAGTWLSMLAAAAGAWVGAGPTFRLIAITSPRPTSV